jgi:hypothetical protein
MNTNSEETHDRSIEQEVTEDTKSE